MARPASITVNVYGEPITIYESTYKNAADKYDACQVCEQDKRTLQVGEVHTYNHINICLDCLISVLPT